MIIDKELMFSNAQALTAAAVSTNVVDQGAAGDAYAALWLVVNNSAAITGTLGFELQTSADEAFTSPITLMSIAAAARSAAGNIFKGRIPVGAKKYLRLNYTGAPTAGSVSAFLVKDARI